ncbi:MAG TPA: kelch repeat-containing protein, partial [Kofleriaceae bacterium]|nr:kelch repeat-containing protein [Kofleriaceae bacterium]
MRTCLLVMLAACTDPAGVPPRGEPWTDGPTMPGRRLEAAVAAYGTRLAVAGGFSTSAQEGLAITREVIALDTLTGAWTSLPELPVAWTHGALAAVGGTLYLLGGLEGGSFIAHGEAFALDLGADAWRPLPALPAGQERGAAAVVASPPHIFLLGGATSSGALASVLDFNVSTATWSRLPDLPTARSHAAAMRTGDGTLIVAGGLADGTSIPLGDVYALPLGATVWQLRESMPTRRGGCAYGHVQGSLVCAGGEAGAAVLRAAEAYDPNTNAWRPLPDLPI